MSYKRILAYFVDIIIISSISSLILFIIPKDEEYQNMYDNYINLVNDYTNKKIELREFNNKVDNSIYIINKSTVDVSIVTIVLSISYFVVLGYFFNGQTLGKRIMKLKLVSNKDKDLSMNQLLIRSLFINSILVNILQVFCILIFSKSIYLKINNVLTYTFGLVDLIIFCMILFRKDNRGLHDLLANTKVLDVSNTNNTDKLKDM